MTDLTVALREKLDAATERPWYDAHGGIWTGDGETLVASVATADAALIVAAVNNLDPLLSALEVATEALRRAEQATTRGEARNHCREGLAHLSAIPTSPPSATRRASK